MDLLKGISEFVGNTWNTMTTPLSSVINFLTGERKRQDDINTQNEVFRREDTALQRRMNDARQAGINPLLVAGQSAQTSAPVISKGGDIDPTALLAPLQTKLLNEQIGVTKAQKAITLAQLPGVEAESEYKDYETKTLKQLGQLKTDTNTVKNIARVKPVVQKVLNAEYRFQQPAKDIGKTVARTQNKIENKIGKYLSKLGIK